MKVGCDRLVELVVREWDGQRRHGLRGVGKVCQHTSLRYDVLTVSYSCRKGLERKAGEMGGEVEY